MISMCNVIVQHSGHLYLKQNLANLSKDTVVFLCFSNTEDSGIITSCKVYQLNHKTKTLCPKYYWN